jgi:ribosomal-protein-alanine N-acetyltransferase
MDLTGKMTNLETARLWLRPLKNTDLGDLANIYRDPEVMKYRLFPAPATREQTQARLEQMMSHWDKHGFGRWAIIYKMNSDFIGHAGLEAIADTIDIEINYLLKRSYWGIGLATEAAKTILAYGFQVLQLPYIIAIAKSENIASLRVIAKLGMNYEKKAQYYGVDWLRYRINRDEWNAETRHS